MEMNFTKWAHYTESSYNYTDEFDTLQECLDDVKTLWNNGDGDDGEFDYDQETDKLLPTVVISRVAILNVHEVRDEFKRQLLEEITDADENYGEGEWKGSDLVESTYEQVYDWLGCNFFEGLEDPESVELHYPDKEAIKLADAINSGNYTDALEHFLTTVDVTPHSIGYPEYYYNVETGELKPYCEVNDTKFHTGDRVRIVSNPRKPDTVGKIGTITCAATDANTKEGIYQVKLDGDKYPLYGWAEEYCLELVKE